MNSQIVNNSAFTSIFDDTKESKLNLHTYMDQYALSIEDVDATANFISMAPQYRKRFYVPDDGIPQMMKLLNLCYKENIVNYFYEIQDLNEVMASGLTFEFKFEADQNKIEFESVVPGFIRILFRDILPRWIAFSEENEKHYCFYLATVNPIYDCKTLKFKSTFRLVIPSIMLTTDIRYFIYQRVWQSLDMKILFEKKLNYRIRDCFMRSMRSAPVTLLGSCDADQTEPLFLDSVRRINIEDGICDGDSVTLSSIESRFQNLVNEASINYPLFDGGIVEKFHYLPLNVCLEKMEDDNDDRQLFQMAYDEAKALFAKRSVTDGDIEFVHDMISMLSDDRFVDVDSWLKVMKAIASDQDRYYCLAVITTKDRAKGLVTWEEFEMYWSEIVNSTKRSRYSSKALRYWAACDSPSRMHRYVEETIKKMLVRDVRDTLIQGRINHSHIASYLYFMFRNTYITYNVTKSSVYWYEFVTPLSSDIEAGQLYKWRNIGSYPDSLSKFISREFKDIAGRVHSDLKSLQLSIAGEEKEDPKVKQIKTLFKAYDKAIISIFNNGFKKSVIEESTISFKRNHFIKQLNKTPNILGVGNGVVEFNGPETKLLEYYHTYPISLYTDTNYVPYDEGSKYVQTVYKMLHSFVPDGEEDALDFLLYYFSTSLDWFPKESLFLIIHGGGCHALDTPIRMFDGSIKMVQDVVVGDKLMGDDSTPRVVQDLYRGTDDMVRIIPERGEPFVVNKNHVLSLKFTNISRVQSYNKSYCAVWYERNGVEEPIRKYKRFNSEEDAHAYLKSICISNEKVIKRGDIIDIKITDLRKWKQHWITYSMVVLYRNGGVIYPEKKLDIDPYDLGYSHKRIPDDYKISSID